MLKIASRILILVSAVFLIVVSTYFMYLVFSYKRIPDNIPIETKGKFKAEKISEGVVYKITSANLGFGAYSMDFSFFMDGGKYSRAYSREEVVKNIRGSIDLILEENADFMLFQEMDFYSTRSHQVDERKISFDMLNEKNENRINSIFAQNYDSPYLFWPVYEPHGKNKSGIFTASRFRLYDSKRISLPIETGLSRFIDLDRCYLKTRIDVENGKQLALYNVHLSAYTTNHETSTRQIEKMNNDMMDEYYSGNYVVLGGDLNREVMEGMSEFFGFESNGLNWSKTFPMEKLNPHLKLIPPVDVNNPVPTVRDTKKPWNGENFVTVIDGFIVSDNVKVLETGVTDSNFEFSDHNPIWMKFRLE